MTETDVRGALRRVTDPELGINIVDLGLVYDIEITGADVRVTMTMTTPACPLRDYIQSLVEQAVFEHVPGVERLDVDIVSEPPWSEEMMTDEGRRQLS